MADFLATFNPGLGTPAPPSDGEINSVGDLQSRLSAAFQANTTSTKVKHVSLTLELRSTARFTIAFSDGDNRALEGSGTTDASPDGLRTSDGRAHDSAGQATRVVSVNETFKNHSDDLVLQRSVVKHILGALSPADTSTWIQIDDSTGSQVSTSTYICKDSLQHWIRQTATNPPHAIFGESSLQGLDPMLMNRPAFDCRGCVRISFNRSSRSITVKYDHTLLHKTVKQLSELFPPPRPQLGPGAQKLLEQKTPKKFTLEGKEKVPNSEKKKKTSSTKRRSGASHENGQQPKKHRKKQAELSAAEGHDVSPDYHDPSQAIAPSWREQPAYHQSTEGQGDGSQNDDDYPSGYVDGSEGAQRGSSGNQHVPQNGSASTVLPFNISPNEAARRLDAARELLRGAGVNLDSLSTEQMHVLSNQAPDLQKDTILNINFGAEQLQVIHPQNTDSSRDVNLLNVPSTQAQILQTVSGFPGPIIIIRGLSPQSAVDLNGGTGRAPSASGSKAKGSLRSKHGLGKSRHACSECKSCKTKVRYSLLKVFLPLHTNLGKCPREKPACSNCQSSGRRCQYPPSKPRSKEPNTIVVGSEEDEADKGDDDQQGRTMEPRHNPQLQQPAPYVDHQQPEDVSYLQRPITRILSSCPEQPALGSRPQDPSYPQSGTGLSMPLPDISTMSHQFFSINPRPCNTTGTDKSSY